jgi:predicted N-acetyltransferase YhbS
MPADVSFRAPTDRDRGSADYLGLLASASGRTGSALQSLAVEVSGAPAVVALDDGRIVGLASYEAGTTGTVLRHLAVEHGHRGVGLGRRLVMSVRDAVPGAQVTAETDDDAVAFYRRTGFAVTALPRDPRWPHVQRYRCVLIADAR